jgi:drug/metabolite transporter (DMT)-like permease
VTAINYLTASCFHAVRHALTRSTFLPTAPTAVVGVLGGVAFVTAFFMLTALMAHRGVSIATAVLRLGVVIPMLVGVVYWGESPGTLQAVGALLALMALPLLTIDPSSSPSVQPLAEGRASAEGLDGTRQEASSHCARRRQTRLLLGLFVGNGLCMLAMRAFRQVGTESESSLFLTVLFGVAGLVALGAWLTHWTGTSRRDLLPGMAVGLCNALANLALVSALQQLPGVLVFPFYSAVGVVLSALFAGLVWGERVRRLELAGMGVAIVAVVLINLG